MENPLLDKSLHFAARIVRLCQYLQKEKKEAVISKQILRSGTSIGANANEAAYGVSQADFIAKLQISLKETAETEYWLRLLILTEYIEKNLYNGFLAQQNKYTGMPTLAVVPTNGEFDRAGGEKKNRKERY